MNKRTVAIVEKLITSEKEVTLESLAEDFSISQRSIRNDIKEINEILFNNGYEEVKLAGGGVVRKGSDLAAAATLFRGEDFYVYKLSKNERVRIAAVEIVNAQEFVTLSQIAESLFVSRATVISDLPDIREQIKKGNLEMISHSNKGLRAEGKESDRRLFLLGMVAPDIGTAREGVIGKFVNVQSGDRIVIRKIVEEQEEAHKSFLTDTSFQRLVIYLGIMVRRNQMGEYVEVRKKKDLSKYSMAQDILKYVSQYCRVRTTEDEAEFLTEILVWAHYMKQENVAGDAVRVQLFTRKLVERISWELGADLNGDYDLFENLSNHIQSVFSAAPVPYPQETVIDEALTGHHEVLEAVQGERQSLEKFAGRAVTDDEIKYVCIHVCAALERRKNKEIAFHVIVACHAGIGTSQLLMSRLKEHFNFHIVDVISAHEAEKLSEDAADFVISTVPLKNCRLEYVVVSPLLNDEDYIRVGSKIDTLRSSRNLPARRTEEENPAAGLMERIRPVLLKEVPDKADVLEKKIGREVRLFFSRDKDTDRMTAPDLHHLLPASHIQLDVEASDWRDAVRKASEYLVMHEYAEPRYVDAMIANIEENGPYVVLSKGFALPHEGVEAGSIKLGMNLIRLKSPVNFGADELDPVDLVCVLCAADHKLHLKALFNLVNMLKTDGFKKDLKAAATPEEAAGVIERYEYLLPEE